MKEKIYQQAVTWFSDKGVPFLIDLAIALVILIVGYFVIRFVVAAVGRAVEKASERAHHTLLGSFIRNVTSKICWILLIVIILGRLGINIAPIIAGLGVTGFILGFAFQESLGNLASGLMIAINEPFKLGDYVIIAGLEGSVRKIDMMATELATPDNKKIVIPNKNAWGAPITNFTALGRRRVDIQVGIDYSSNVVKAIQVALDVLPTIPGVLLDPKPVVNVAKLNESEITLNIRPWAEGENYWNVYNDTQIAIKAAFEKNAINIPFPQLTVHLDGKSEPSVQG